MIRYLQSLALLIAILIGIFFLARHHLAENRYETRVAELGEFPDWTALSPYDGTMSEADFLSTLTRYYSTSAVWKDYFSVKENEVHFETRRETQSVAFSPPGAPSSSPARYWRTKRELLASPRPQKLPLHGVKITLDPGHIGGKCARIEERWFQIEEDLPVMEGEMTLLVALHLRAALTELGATVTLTRELNEPVGQKRSPHFRALAKAKVKTLDLDPALLQKYQDKLFYRTAEIRARARLINEEFQPDLVLALHFNAEAWGDPNRPTLTDSNHFHILVNGAYTAGEWKQEDQRFELARRLFQRTIEEEIALSKALTRSFKEWTGLPPYQYEPNSQRAVQVDEEGYIWARNLLANRIYECPVLFLEPYIMNSKAVYERIQLGDYEGERLVNGERRLSIFREYTQAVVAGLLDYYEER